MNSDVLGKALIRELLSNPARFAERGTAYELLQHYFQGLALESLRPLLAHDDVLVQRAAIWVLSELGAGGCSLLDDAIRLADSRDRYVMYHVLEIAIVCAIGENVDKFYCVPRAIESDDDVIRLLAMRLVSNADQSQLEAGTRGDALGKLNSVHRDGLTAIARASMLKPAEVRRMIGATTPLIRRYGAIAARRLASKQPELIADARLSPDPDVRRFAEEEPLRGGRDQRQK